YLLINGNWGFPALGIRGAAWAMVGGAWLAFAIGLAMMMQSKFRREFNTLAGWRPDLDLFRRMMRFGLPSGAQYSLEALAFSVFLMMVGHLGTAQLSATSIAFTINMTAIVPMVGLSQSVSVLVGQRLGEDRPDVAARTTLRGVAWCLFYTLIAATSFVTVPNLLARQFGDPDPDRWAEVAP